MNESPTWKKQLKRCWRALPSEIKGSAFTCCLGLQVPRSQNVEIPHDAPIAIAGFFNAATGLGQGARLQYQRMILAGRCVQAIDLTQVLLQPTTPGLFAPPLQNPRDLVPNDEYGLLAVHVNPPVFMLALWWLKPLLVNKRRVAFWAWELMDIPRYWRRCLPYIDEVHVPSSFCAQAVRPHTQKPIVVDPHSAALPPSALPQKDSTKCVKGRTFAEDGVVRVLSIFDAASCMPRKNPLAAIAAFHRAFGDDMHANLHLKATSLEMCPSEAKQLIEKVKQHPNIFLSQDRLSAAELECLFKNNDIYISLHRSEGYGLPLHEALQHGLEVVATAWSGNREFMSGERSHLVPYRMVPVRGAQTDCYVKSQVWAEPDTEWAAQIMSDIVKVRRPDLTLMHNFQPSVPLPIRAADTTVVIVNYQGRQDTMQCLSAILSLRTAPARIIVVDNGSGKDETMKVFEKWTQLSSAQGRAGPVILPSLSDTAGTDLPQKDCLICEPHNKGFAAGVNIGLRVALRDPHCRACWLVNNDASPESEALDALCQRLNERPDAGMTGSILVESSHPARVQCAGGGTFSAWTGITRDLLQGAPLDTTCEHIPEFLELQLGFLNAASLLVPSDTINRVGLFDENFFLYYEDVDYSLRVKKAGYSIIIANKSVVHHKCGSSVKRADINVNYYAFRNRLYVMRKHYKSRFAISLIRNMISCLSRCISFTFKSIQTTYMTTKDALRMNHTQNFITKR